MPERNRLPLKPSTVMRRVAYQMVLLDHKHNPDMYQSFPPSRVLELAESARRNFTPIYPVLAWYARNMAHGFKLKELRDCGWEYTNRALTKRRPAAPRRYD